MLTPSPWDGAPCATCPLAEGVCRARALRNPNLCDRANPGHPTYQPAYRDLVARPPDPPPPRVAPRPPVVTARARPPSHGQAARELIVSAYREDLTWIQRVEIPTTVYHKQAGALCPDHVACVPLENTGRESFSYLTHIVECYDSLAEWTVFCQGDPRDHCPDFLARMHLASSGPTSLTARYSEHFPPQSVKDLDQVVNVGGFEVRYGDARLLGAQTWERNRPWLLRAWNTLFPGDPPHPWRFGYAATWLVPRASILARPRAFWGWLRDGLSGPAGHAATPWEHAERWPLNPWAFEVLWLYLFSDPALYPNRPPPVPLALHRERLAQVRACPHWSRPGCGCQQGRCTLGKGRDGLVAFEDCFTCLELT